VDGWTSVPSHYLIAITPRAHFINERKYGGDTLLKSLLYLLYSAPVHHCTYTYTSNVLVRNGLQIHKQVIYTV